MNFSNSDLSIKSKNINMIVLQKTYLLLSLTMIPTAIGALIGINLSFSFLASSPILGVIALIAVMYGLMFMVEKNKNGFSGVIWLMIFSLLMGALLGPLLQIAAKIPNGSQLILLAALLTSIVFFVMSAMAFTIKKQTPMLTNFLTVGLIVIFVGMIANIFFHTPMFQLMLCGGFVILSSLLILWQVNQILIGGETSYISAALSIYISIYNIFSSLLQIIMALSGNKK